jgi:acyl phosphate:glycerol-3-phosphate acyltransferase
MVAGCIGNSEEHVEGGVSEIGLMRVLTAGAAGYALGVTPAARVAARMASGGSVDVGRDGSGNPGALNAMRLLGRRHGYAVAVVDVGKGAGAALVGRRLAGDLGAHVGAVSAVAGHCYPPPRLGRGGMGVATSFGQCLATFPAFAPVDAAVALAASRLPTRRPAAAAIAASALCWVGAGALWSRHRLPNLWGPPPRAALPLANALTCALIASRALSLVRARRPDELVLGRGTR